jgi:S1-C subfamily serine protease
VRLPDGRQGVIVIDVPREGPAAQGGVLIGDVLVKLAGATVADTDDVHAQLGPDSVGKRIKAAISRGGQDIDVQITVGERPKGEN